MTTLAERRLHPPLWLVALVAGGIWLVASGIAIDGTVVLAGRVPTREQVAGWLGVCS